jgi:cobalt-zinc-cadmium efflux system outer membrane protein
MSFPVSRWALCAALLFAPAAYGKKTSPSASDPEKLTMEDAIQKTLAASPRLASAEEDVRASEGARMQAGLRPNPEASLQTENFVGSGEYGGVDRSETTLGLSQVIERGGKRMGRMAVAERETAISRFGQAMERLETIRDVAVAYASAAAAQETLKLTAEQKDLANDLFKEAVARVNAAREPLIRKSKAEIAVSAAGFAHERATRELSHAKHALANLWGGHDDRFRIDEKDFFLLTPPMTEAEAEGRMKRHPELGRYRADQGRMEARYALEKMQSVPDLRVHVGLRDFRESGDRAWIAGVSVPIPAFNRNQGNIEKARHEAAKAESDAQAAALAMTARLHEALEAQTNAYRLANLLKTSILPAAEKTFALSRQGYRSGKFPYLEVLDAERTLFEAKERHIVALKEYRLAKAEAEFLTARHAEIEATREEAHAQ